MVIPDKKMAVAVMINSNVEEFWGFWKGKYSAGAVVFSGITEQRNDGY